MSFMRALLQRLTLVLLSVVLMIGVVVSAPAFASTVTVGMGEGNMLAFSPANVKVSPGDTVHFDVTALGPHNVVFDPNAPSDITAASHKGYEMSGSFDIKIPSDAAKGDYTYYCEPHRGAGMVGTITVQ